MNRMSKAITIDIDRELYHLLNDFRKHLTDSAYDGFISQYLGILFYAFCTNGMGGVYRKTWMTALEELVAEYFGRHPRADDFHDSLTKAILAYQMRYEYYDDIKVDITAIAGDDYLPDSLAVELMRRGRYAVISAHDKRA